MIEATAATEEELLELQRGVLAYWYSLNKEGSPSRIWKCNLWHILFGRACEESGESSMVDLEAWEEAWVRVYDAIDDLPVVAFLLNQMVDHRKGPIARSLLRRVVTLAEEALVGLAELDRLEESA